MKACETHDNCIVVFNADDCPLCKSQKMLTTVWEEVEKSMGILKELKGTAEQAGLKLGSS
jgi:RNA polymerase subunit RPABC4/transcription elongation factor Spt4